MNTDIGDMVVMTTIFLNLSVHYDVQSGMVDSNCASVWVHEQPCLFPHGLGSPVKQMGITSFLMIVRVIYVSFYAGNGVFSLDGTWTGTLGWVSPFLMMGPEFHNPAAKDGECWPTSGTVWESQDTHTHAQLRDTVLLMSQAASWLRCSCQPQKGQ